MGCLAGTFGLSNAQPESEQVPQKQKTHIKADVVSADRIVFWDSLVVGSRHHADRYISIKRDDEESMHIELQHNQGYSTILNPRGLFLYRDDIDRAVMIEAYGIAVHDTKKDEVLGEFTFDQIINAMKE